MRPWGHAFCPPVVIGYGYRKLQENQLLTETPRVVSVVTQLHGRLTFGQIDFVFDDSLVSIEHQGYLLCVLTVRFAPPSKPVALSFSATEYQIWYDLMHLKRFT